jgi:carboxypeptidase Q
VGQGAHDDGGGCIVAWEAVRLLKELGLRPRRTIRVVLYTNEENGLRGGNAYRDAHRAEIAKHILAIESDSGVYRPEGFGLERQRLCKRARTMQEIAKLLAGNRRRSDCGGWRWRGYWANHARGRGGRQSRCRWCTLLRHSPHTADTLDKVNPRELALCVATMAVMAYTVADMPEEFGRR